MTDAPEPITLAQAKQHLRVAASFTADDDLISENIVSAREFIEAETGLVIIPRQLTETAARLGQWIDLDSWPVTSIDAIRYPANGAMVTLDPSAWAFSLKQRPVRILPRAWGWGVASGGWLNSYLRVPQLPVEIDVSAGYATPDVVPARVRRAVFLLVAHYYTNRSAAEVGSRAVAVPIPFAVQEHLAKLKQRII